MIPLKILLWLGAAALLVLQSRQLLYEAQAENALRNASTFEELENEKAISTFSPQLAKRRGDYWVMMAEPADLGKATGEYRRAVRMDPSDSDYWVTLANALSLSGKPTSAADAYSMADRLDPMNHHIQQAIGNFHLGQGNLGLALEHHAKAIKQYPSLARGIYVLYWNLGQPVTEVAKALLGDNALLKQRYLQDALISSSPDEADALWRQFQQPTGTLDALSHRRYFDYLIKNRLPDRARQLWHLIAQTFYDSAWEEQAEAFWNRDFSRPILFEGGLEWVQTPAPEGMSSELSKFDTVTGARSVYLSFDGTSNISWSGISHAFFVEPGKSYKISFRVRCRNITTNNGPYVRLTVPAEKTVQERSEPYVGMADERGEITFTVPPESFIAEMRICRDFSRKLNNKIGGEAWFSDFQLVEADTPSTRPESVP